ncbi:PREDICTED: CBL-interacting protein kinase 17 [Bactrocera latifrons]|uniref:CBL-interacting protein kinase 17 n=1 Tax=Bactrocera latifrons TaxID=174628 RepID=UPI0008DD8CA1|nr:PREDICTED: CBL-interacting protein kinase 17 [Bactrocera latifrons]
MDTSNSVRAQINENHLNVINYAPPSPASSLSSESMDVVISPNSPCSPATTPRLHRGGHDSSSSSYEHFCTPKKSLADSRVLERIREKLGTPSTLCEMHALRPEQSREEEAVKVVKNRFLISTQLCYLSPAVAARTPASYRHLIDLKASSLRCTDVFTETEYICKIINEPHDKVQRAYYDIKTAGEVARSSLYGHTLIRDIHEIVPLDANRSYLIIPPPKAQEGAEGVYEDLHTYVRNKRRLHENEAKALFHQIAETVRLCHQKGVILRDLKLKRFFFIDEARTKIQYESLEGSMILNDPADDTLSDKIGCPLYTAPELLCPNPTYQGKPADMWSLGVILYTMLVGQYPFYERPNCNLITIIRHGQVQIPSCLPRSVRWLLLLLLCKDYKERLHADEVFLTPWLKQQRPHDYVYLSVDTNLDDLEMESDDDTDVLEQTPSRVEGGAQQMHYTKDCQVDNNSQNIAAAHHFVTEEDCQEDEDADADDCDISNTEPLNYSHTHTTATGNSSQQHAIVVDDDVEMS